MQTSRTCSNCHGTGKIIKTPCEKCKGSGKVREQTKIKVEIPAGIYEGGQLRAAGKGEAGELGGPNGDLYIVIRIRKSGIYTRNKNDVGCVVPITITQATLGAELKIPMVDGGEETYKIPEGTQTGTEFVIRGKGFNYMNSATKGDFVFKVDVQTPKKLSKEQRALMVELAKTMNEQPPVKRKGIFG